MHFASLKPHPQNPHTALLIIYTSACSTSSSSTTSTSGTSTSTSGTSTSSSSTTSTSSVPCRSDLYITTDFGNSWTLLHPYVEKAIWTSSTPAQIIFQSFNLSVSSNVSQSSLLPYSSGLFAIPNPQVSTTTSYLIATNIAGFLYRGSVLFYASYISPQVTNQLALYISTDQGLSFFQAQFPYDHSTAANLIESRYNIPEVNPWSVFVNVDHSRSGDWGRTYVSGPGDKHFVEILKYNQRTFSGVDFRKIGGIEGIYFANILLNVEGDTNDNPNFDDGGQEPLEGTQGKSVISFDNGGNWQVIKPPNIDANHNPIHCEPNCTLQLFGPTQSTYTQVYSNDNTVGLILASGNIGTYLLKEKFEVNTYFSRNAGQDWEEITKGEYAFEFIDRGSVILLMKFQDNDQTNSIKYSLNEALTWQECTISTDHQYHVTNILSNPRATGKAFYIQAQKKQSIFGNFQNVIIKIDFSNFRERQCLATDYEDWSPFDKEGKDETTNNNNSLCYGNNNSISKKKKRLCLLEYTLQLYCSISS